MNHPLMRKSSNGPIESLQDGKQGIKVSSREAVEPIVGNSELPHNFGEVVKGIYRSSFPHISNLPALKVLGLRTIITLVEEPYTQSHTDFLEDNAIKHYRIPFIANKDPTIKTPECVLNVILRLMLNTSNHPMLIHCNKGKHRTGCVTGCFRKLQGWDIREIIEEYIRYSRPKQRALDEAYIEEFDPSTLSHLAKVSGAGSWNSEDQNVPGALLQLPHGIRVES
ncbi:tyrosine phosphatase family-domain-containing protein [Aspergillus unguis]